MSGGRSEAGTVIEERRTEVFTAPGPPLLHQDGLLRQDGFPHLLRQVILKSSQTPRSSGPIDRHLLQDLITGITTTMMALLSSMSAGPTKKAPLSKQGERLP